MDRLLADLEKSLANWLANRDDIKGRQELLHLTHTLKGSAYLARLTTLADRVHALETLILCASEASDGDLCAALGQHWYALLQARDHACGGEGAGMCRDAGAEEEKTMPSAAARHRMRNVEGPWCDTLPGGEHETREQDVRMRLVCEAELLSAECRQELAGIDSSLQELTALLEGCAVSSACPALCRYFSEWCGALRELVKSPGDTGRLPVVHELLDAVMVRMRRMERLLRQQARVAHDVHLSLQRQFGSPVEQPLAESGLHQVVRQLSRELDKDASLEFEVDDPGLDDSVLHEWIPIMEQVLWNAVAHGIESGVRRRRAGKPGRGLIGFRVSRTREGMRIDISDDGAGVDVDRLRKRAVELGLEDARDASAAPRDPMRLALCTGLSVKPTAAPVAGSGLGLGALQGKLQRRGGEVDIDSIPGRGTRLRIRVPMNESGGDDRSGKDAEEGPRRA